MDLTDTWIVRIFIRNQINIKLNLFTFVFFSPYNRLLNWLKKSQNVKLTYSQNDSYFSRVFSYVKKNI